MQCFKLKEKVGHGRQEGSCSGDKHWHGAVAAPGKMVHGLLVWYSKLVEGQCLLRFRPCSERQMLEAVVELSLTGAHF